jgi:hypothetical protein
MYCIAQKTFFRKEAKMSSVWLTREFELFALAAALLLLTNVAY